MSTVRPSSDIGPQGMAATMAVGTVATGSPGSSVSISNAGSSSAAVFNFTIPRGDVGVTGASGINAIGYPTARTLSLATAYQATDPSRPAIVTINVTSAATLSLSGGTTITGEVRVGTTNGVASGSGAAVASYTNSSTGTLTIGINTQTVSTVPLVISLPIGGYFALRQTAGSGLTIVSAFDQVIG